MARRDTVPVALLLLLAAFTGLIAEDYFNVAVLEGSARVERSEKKEWEDLALGKQINNNDIVETFFQTRLAMQIGDGNTIILGSNTKLMVAIAEKRRDGEKIAEISLTLFAGGAFAKAVSKCKLLVYTSHALAEVDSGAVSAVVEERSGETGFQVLEGAVAVRNIAQQKGKTLSAGQTTIIFPRKEPTVPLYITSRHVAVLKHFFGDRYIQHQLASSGITPTEEVAEAPRSRRLSESMIAKKESQKRANEDVYKRVFDTDRIYSFIAEDQASNSHGVRRIGIPARVSTEKKAELSVAGGAAIANGISYPNIIVVPSFTVSVVDVGLRLRVAKNHERFGALQFGDLKGILDLVDHLSVGLALGDGGDSLHATAHTVSDLTLGSGLVVHRYNASNPYLVFSPLGLEADLNWRILRARGFVADLSDFATGGIYLDVRPGMFYCGAGFYYDANQYHGLNYGPSARFFVPDSTELSDTLQSPVYSYEIGFGSDMASRYDICYGARADFAQKFLPGRMDGWALRAPNVYLSLHRFSAQVFSGVEMGRFLPSQFHSFYPANRMTIDTSGQFVTQNGQLSSDRLSGNVGIRLEANPHRGIHLDASFRHELFTVNALEGHDSTSHPFDYEYHLRVAVDDSLVKWIKFAQLYVSQTHGGLFPSYDRNWGLSWGFAAGLDVTSSPLFFDLSLQAGARFGYLDLLDDAGSPALNNHIDSGDYTIEFYGGIRWGFL